MTLIALFFVVLSGWLFNIAPGGVSILTVSSFISLIIAIILYFASSKRDLSIQTMKLGKELGLTLTKSFSVGAAAHSKMAGLYKGHQASVYEELIYVSNQQTWTPGRLSYRFIIAVQFENVSKISLRISQKEPRWNIYFGSFLPRVNATPSWAKELEICGKPESQVISLVSSIKAGDIEYLKNFDFRSLTINKDQCAIQLQISDNPLEQNQLTRLLDFCINLITLTVA